MRWFNRLAICFYVAIILIVGFSSLLFLAHFLSLRSFEQFLGFVYFDPKAGLVAGFIVAGAMLISLAFARIIYGREEKERIIALNNPLGRVTISLSALEDMLRRMVARTPQIKELKPDISAIRKGLEIDIRLVLSSDANIPELTADLQGLIKRKVQEVVGVDEKVNIRIHVVKISADAARDVKARDYDDQDMGEAAIPFRGYRP
ncbi:MAG: alkaline shock response membrane anchor protein AmaP [Candidatus Omnitrophica bacterium]|nr:alkaline shock response membrane anchor protein AmaP [Candidatus Omnitrophota bacterium]